MFTRDAPCGILFVACLVLLPSCAVEPPHVGHGPLVDIWISDVNDEAAATDALRQHGIQYEEYGFVSSPDPGWPIRVHQSDYEEADSLLERFEPPATPMKPLRPSTRPTLP
jgi:hypothetical protein